MSKYYCLRTDLATLIAWDTATLPKLMLWKDSNVLQCTVKPHIPLTHTVPSPDLETPPEPDLLVCLLTSGGGGGVKNKEVQLHSELCGCQCLPSTRCGGAAVLTPAALTLSGWRTQPVSSYLAASRALIWTLLLLLWRAESLARATRNCRRRGKVTRGWSVVTLNHFMTWSKYLSWCLSWGGKQYDEGEKSNKCRRVELNVQEKAPFIRVSVLKQSPYDAQIHLVIVFLQWQMFQSPSLSRKWGENKSAYGDVMEAPTLQIRCLFLPLVVVPFQTCWRSDKASETTYNLFSLSLFFLAGDCKQSAK